MQLTTCCIVESLHNSVCCCFALLRFITWRHEIDCGVLFFFFNYCKAAKKKAKGKRNHYSVIEQNALSDNYMANILKCSYPQITGQNDRRDESLTGQVHDQAGHCPLTGRYFEHGETVADDLLRIAIYLPEFRRSKQCMKFPKWSCGDTLVVAE